MVYRLACEPWRISPSNASLALLSCRRRWELPFPFKLVSGVVIRNVSRKLETKT